MKKSPSDISTDLASVSGRDSARLTIDLAALQNNFRTMREKSGSAQTAAVVKSNAYGIGLAQAVPALRAAGCEVFFVATLAEALQCRQLADDAKIICFNGYSKDDDAIYRRHSIWPCLTSLEHVKDWQTACQKHGAAPAVLHLDTGFNRLGLDQVELESLIASPEVFTGWELGLIMSHLACADTPDHPMNKAQLERFRDALARLPKAPASLANSGGIWLGSGYHFDLTRCGISLYGAAAQDTATALETVVKVFAHIVQLRNIVAGDTVGYGAGFTASRGMRIGIISAGYADGINRAAGRANPPFGKVHIAGQTVDIIGRISMDLMAVDLTDHPHNIELGQEVEIIGPNAPIDALAKAANTIAYELLTKLGSRYKRNYV